MLPQNMKEPGSHASCCNNILTVSDLPDLRTHNLCNARPARHTDYNGNRHNVRLPENCLQQNDKQQIGHAEQDFRQTNPIDREIRPPYQIMEKISRPIVSVPKRNSLFGARL